jgi:hypothetical protein
MFTSGIFSKIYFSIIEKAKQNNNEPNMYYEAHHIIPASMGGSNKKDNIVFLTAKEHFICHYLLAKIVIDEKDRNKMIWAFYMMCVDPVIGSTERKKSARYELARKLFSENHPTKNKDIVEKIRNSTIEYYKSDIYQEKRKKTAKYVECRCGCGTLIEYHGNDIPKFLNMKHYRLYLRSDNKPPVKIETRKKQSNIAKTRIENMTTEQRKERIKKSFLSCDHEERGKNISKGKKDKSTNQQEIMGKKYAAMSDEEFKIFIYKKERPDNITKRMINLRDKYIADSGS